MRAGEIVVCWARDRSCACRVHREKCWERIMVCMREGSNVGVQRDGGCLVVDRMWGNRWKSEPLCMSRVRSCALDASV